MISEVEKQWKARQLARARVTSRREFQFWWTWFNTDPRKLTRAQRQHKKSRELRGRHNPVCAMMRLAKIRQNAAGIS